MCCLHPYLPHYQPLLHARALSAAGGRKRPLVPNLAELLEEGEEGEDGGAAVSEVAGRRSDGGALLRERQSVGSGSAAGAATGSPPHKFQRRSEWRVLAAGGRVFAPAWFRVQKGLGYGGLPCPPPSFPLRPRTCFSCLPRPCHPAADEEDAALDAAVPARPSSVAEVDADVLAARVRELQTQVWLSGQHA